ncbi:MAG: hypothetical protein A6F71_01620 [Cycloclasticus sp. symbiont of Poecilosclerida sp. M]|nr:MAG: hypothetical protein A6F71_01620 [Cycloclasticus sp. symbiont of Poecilosclerida sp. M]
MPEDDDKLSDSGLFKQYVGSVKKTVTSLQTDNTQKPKPKPYKKHFALSASEKYLATHLDTPIGGHESVFFARSGTQDKTIRRLKRGQFEIEACLDLHGRTQSQALNDLTQFIDQQGEFGHRVLIIIHGKGLRSKNQHAVLKNLSVALLKNHPYVLAFCSAQAKDGGQGASYVLLKRLER